ncbi:MAG: nicotinamide-nucleotide amidase [Halieaceae bacterium]|jgi:nicotinamide-nucleotide amidase
MPAQPATIEVLLTGNEVMSGDTIDSNSSVIAHRLTELSLTIHRKVTVGDDFALLVEEMKAQIERAGVLIVNGGLGPTVDDLTAQILAEVAGLELVENQEAIEHLEHWCSARGSALNAANRKQAYLPAGCEVIPNPVGSAVGFQLEVNGCLVICTPGVPSELRAMLDHILSTLHLRYPNSGRTHILRLQCFGMGESALQQLIDDKLTDWPSEVELGFRAGAPQVEVKLTIRDEAHRAAQLACRDQLYALIGDYIVGEGETKLAEAVLELLSKNGQTITTAESCTGGLIASLLTEIPGSSRAFQAGFVTYANHIKSSILGVGAETLETHGAVSEQVVLEMAEGALQKSGADYAIAASGIAGPDGGEEGKPVGTVWLAWGQKGQLRSGCLRYGTNRKLFQVMAAAAALDLTRRELLGINTVPRYFIERSGDKSSRW